jgi:hypothetical protein
MRNFYDRNEHYNELCSCIGHHNEGKKAGEVGFALEYALFKGFLLSTIHPVNGVEIEWEPNCKYRRCLQVGEYTKLPGLSFTDCVVG